MMKHTNSCYVSEEEKQQYAYHKNGTLITSGYEPCITIRIPGYADELEKAIKRLNVEGNRPIQEQQEQQEEVVDDSVFSRVPTGLGMPHSCGIQKRITHARANTDFIFCNKSCTNICCRVFEYCWGSKAPKQFQSVWYSNETIHTLVFQRNNRRVIKKFKGRSSTAKATEPTTTTINAFLAQIFQCIILILKSLPSGNEIATILEGEKVTIFDILDNNKNYEMHRRRVAYTDKIKTLTKVKRDLRDIITSTTLNL